ncbi:hypothetical protein ALC53_12049 [Atta colombica]|uniref:Uncharacterized protein n=1 Tax=Atta colombica TaxID=520822 RepID=A0A195AZU4_9HYME|nr:hypothetical protein ALC53_12049 [Atta colombica]
MLTPSGSRRVRLQPIYSDRSLEAIQMRYRENAGVINRRRTSACHACSGKGRSLIEGHVCERILDDARRRRRGSTLFPQVIACAGSSDEVGSEGGKWEEGSDRAQGPISSLRDSRVRNSTGAVVSENRVATVAEFIGSVPVRDHSEPGATGESGRFDPGIQSTRSTRRVHLFGSCPDSFGGVSLAIDNNKAML